jgi:rRNA maturation protein Rpf1
LSKRQPLLLTTSRRPTRNMRTLCNEISYNIPFAIRINRGKLSLEGIAEKSIEVNAEKVLIIERWKFGVGKIQLFYVKPIGLERVPPTIYVRHVRFRRDLAAEMMRGRRIKSIAMAASLHKNAEVMKLEKALSDFLTLQVLSLEEVVNRKYDAAMQIKTTSQKDLIITFMLLPELVEIGPQIWVSHLVWS